MSTPRTTRQARKGKQKGKEVEPQTPVRGAPGRHASAVDSHARAGRSTGAKVTGTDNKESQVEVLQTSPLRMAIVRSELAPEKVAEWLPTNYVKLTSSCKNEEEWKSKVRWSLAVLFYRIRHFNNSVIRAILQAFQPTNPGILDATSGVITLWFRNTILELQDAIWFAHEKLAKVFLLKTTAGKQYLQNYSKQSDGHRPRPRITPEQLQDLLPLSVSEVRGIWTPIEYTADFSHWDPLSKTPKVIMEALRRASYALLVRIISHWVRGGKLNTELSISATARLKDLQSTTNIEDPPVWPKPPPRSDRPCTAGEWVEYPSTYTTALESPYYQRLIERISDSELPLPGSETKRRKRAAVGSGDDVSDMGDEPMDDGDGDDDDDSLSESSLSSAVSVDSGHDSGPDVILPKTMHCKPLSNTKNKSANEIIALDGSDEHDINEELPDKPLNAAIRSFHSLEVERCLLPPFPPGAQAHTENRNWRDKKAAVKIIKEPGPSLSLQLLGGEPMSQEPEGETLPEGDIKAVDSLDDIHSAQHEEAAKDLYHEAMDGDWYEDREATHIAVLSSVGKAEHAMRCLNHDIKRYTRLICRLHALRNRDLEMIEELNAKRLVAIKSQTLVEDLLQGRAEADHTYKALRRQQRLAEESNDSSLPYASTSEGKRIIPNSKTPIYGLQGQAANTPGPTRPINTSGWRDSPPTGAPDKRRASQVSQQATTGDDPTQWQDPMSLAEEEDANALRRKRKAERREARHAAKRTKLALDQAESGPSNLQGPRYTYRDILECTPPTQGSFDAPSSQHPSSQMHLPSSQSDALLRPTGHMQGNRSVVGNSTPVEVHREQEFEGGQNEGALPSANQSFDKVKEPKSSSAIDYQQYQDSLQPRTRPEPAGSSNVLKPTGAPPDAEPENF